MKDLSIEGKLNIRFEEGLPGAVPAEALPPDAVPAAAEAPPPPGPEFKEEVLDTVRNILGRRQQDDAVRLEAGLGLLSRRFEGEFRHIHQRLDERDDGAGGSRKRVKYDLLQVEDLKKE